MKIFISVTVIFSLNLYKFIHGLEENEFCTNPNTPNSVYGGKGTCTTQENCKGIQQMVRTGFRPIICGWKNGRNPIICCPDQQEQPKTTRQPVVLQSRQSDVNIVRQKCIEYGKTVREEVADPSLGNSAGSSIIIDHCGRIAERMILGGIEAEPREFPHIALIGYGDPPDYACGGSLISERFILSAAHCSRPVRRGSARWAKLGELDTSTEDEEADPQEYRIIEIINHPDYDKSAMYNDIALYKLDRDVDFTAFIRPTCLHTDKEVNGFLTASGWGHTEWGGVLSSKLMKVDLEHVSIAVCNSNFSQTIEKGKQIPQGIKESMVCAGNELRKDACQGDSGGPLTLNLTEPYCMYDLVGVTSFGRGCGLGFPGVFTRVSHYIPWIVQHVWPDN